MNNEKFIDEMLDVFIESKKDEFGANETVLELVKKDLKQNITKEVWRSKKEEIIKDAEKEYKKKMEDKKKSQIRVVLLETLFLGCLIGLIVNQGTDIITMLKLGTDNNLSATLFIITILLVISVCMVFYMYLDKLDEFFIKD